MTENQPGEPRPDLPDPPPRDAMGGLEEIERLNRAPARFSCLGLGCLTWIVILAIAFAIYFWWRAR
jgi:hypothetical protein